MVSRGTANTNMGCIKCRLVLLVIVALRIDAHIIVHSEGFVGRRELSNSNSSNQLVFANIKVLKNAIAKGAVCLDGSPPAYNFQQGSGSGTYSWLVHMENNILQFFRLMQGDTHKGGGWCSDTPSCSERALSALGSSLYMGNTMAFTGVLSGLQTENPDFYNWNRVMVRYCDGSSFTGDLEEVDPGSKLHLRGQRIWQAVMEDLLAQGMDKAEQALLTGCSAGGLATFIHCDEFRDLLPKSVKVKCMPDAGFFMDSENIEGINSFRSFYDQIVTFHGSLKHLPVACTSKMDPASLCFFPQYLLQLITTPLLVVNSAYDPLQIGNILVPVIADPNNNWQKCKMNITTCAPWQLKIMEGFRNDMISALTPVSNSTAGGLFINSCYAHCQTTVQFLWNSPDSPKLYSKTIAEAAGEWFFDSGAVKYIDCPFPCDSTCNNDFYS